MVRQSPDSVITLKTEKFPFQQTWFSGLIYLKFSNSVDTFSKNIRCKIVRGQSINIVVKYNMDIMFLDFRSYKPICK